jgi:glyceraldehyde-3-phosphate dehydrogenase (NADP+)
LWLDGKEASSDSRVAHEIYSPFSDRKIGELEEANREDVASAVEAAERAWVENIETPGHIRAKWLHDAATALVDRSDEIIDLLIETLGKPRRLSGFETKRGIDLLHLCAEEISRMRGETIPLDAVAGGEGYLGMTQRESLGPVVAITPFNAPVNLLMQKVAPALAMGNAVLIKPAPEGAAVALMIAETLSRFVPAGLVQVLPGGPEVALQLVAHPKVRAVSLTGGVVAGEAVLKAAGVKPVMLELGSNAPNIVCADADLDDAAGKIAEAAFSASGQQCISAQRVIVDASVYTAFVDRFAAASDALVVGDPSDGATDIGPLLNERHRDRVASFIADAESLGAKLPRDGRPDTGLLYGPTIVMDPPDEALIMCQEVFGPVAAVVKADGLDDAINRANDTELGLQAACFTAGLESALAITQRLRFGSVWVNQASRFRLDTYPFGGYRKSGFGREGVRYAMEAFSQIKFIGFAHSQRG